MRLNGKVRLILLPACMAVAVLLTSCNSYRTSSGRSKSFTFVQISDTQLGFSDYQRDIDSFRQAAAQINDLNPNFVVICGDLVNHAGDESFSDFEDIRSSLKMPCYCVPGNHDIGNKPTPESLRRYRETIGDDYFEVEHEETTFIFVNTQLWKEAVEGESEKQDVWLKERLEIASRKSWQVFVVGHYPLFCRKADEPEEYMNLPPDKREKLLNLYDQNNVVAVLHGHTHKLTLNSHKGIQMVGAETTSKNFDKRPLGFRLWHAGGKLPPTHEFVPLAR
jgi:3',5'-cyclic AMP phosphodiesterase CpdA